MRQRMIGSIVERLGRDRERVAAQPLFVADHAAQDLARKLRRRFGREDVYRD